MDNSRVLTFSIHNGEVLDHFEIPVHLVVDEIRQQDTTEIQNPTEIIRESLERPIGCESLDKLVLGSKKILIISDDLTRPTPVHLILPEVLAQLKLANISDENIQILIATGTHRPMTYSELVLKLGEGVPDRLVVLNHRYDDFENLVSLGETPSGIPITVNRLVLESDFVIGIGNIVPHRYCGWAGGAKIIQPGVSGEDTTAATHLMITKDPEARLGQVENTVRWEIEAVAEQVGLSFIVNTVLNHEQKIVAVVAGEMRQAFRAGVEIAKLVCGAEFHSAADIVIASAYPIDINLWQAGKALYSADLVTKDGGLIILVSPCSEGVGEHGSFRDLIFQDYESIEKLITSGSVDKISAAAALAVALVRQRVEVWMVTQGVTEADCKKMGFKRFLSVSEAVEVAMVERPGATFSIMHNACEVLPIIKVGQNA